MSSLIRSLNIQFVNKSLLVLLLALHPACIPFFTEALNSEEESGLDSIFLLGAGLAASNSSGIGRIDITGARAVLVADRNLVPGAADFPGKMSFAATSQQVFAKALTDGSFAEVVIENEAGVPIPGKLPDQVYDATSDYMIIVIDDAPYLVRKSDGTAFDLAPVGLPAMLTTDTAVSGNIRKSIYSDSSGNIYYLSSGRVKKIDVTNPDFLTAQNVTPDNDRVAEFAVDQAGHIIYTAFGVKRIRKNNGGLLSLPNNSYAFWVGNDGKIYDVQSTGIKKIVIDGALNVTTPTHSALKPTVYQGYQYAYIYLPQRILAISDQSYEFENPARSPRQLHFAFLAFANRKIVKGGNQYWFVATRQGALIRVNPADDSFVTLIPDGSFDYFRMEATNEDVVYFNALRLSDGKKVIGTVSAAGVVSIALDDVQEEVLILQKIN